MKLNVDAILIPYVFVAALHAFLKAEGQHQLVNMVILLLPHQNINIPHGAHFFRRIQELQDAAFKRHIIDLIFFEECINLLRYFDLSTIHQRCLKQDIADILGEANSRLMQSDNQDSLNLLCLCKSKVFFH